MRSFTYAMHGRRQGGLTGLPRLWSADPMTDRSYSPQPMSAGEAARYLGVNPKTLARWEQQGRLPGTRRTLGGHRRYDPVEIDALTTIARRPSATPDDLDDDEEVAA